MRKLKNAASKIFCLPTGSNFQFHGKTLFFCFYLFAFLFCLSTAVLAQEESPDNAPPPLKIISKEEKKQLNAETNIKKHTILALELMDARLTKAESLNVQKNFREMFNELGGFNALIDDTLSYLNKHDTGRGKVLDNFKRLELSLRKFAPRLELIRRDLPIRYEPYVRRLIRYIREARSKAVAPFFDDSVVSQKEN